MIHVISCDGRVIKQRKKKTQNFQELLAGIWKFNGFGGSSRYRIIAITGQEKLSNPKNLFTYLKLVGTNFSEFSKEGPKHARQIYLIRITNLLRGVGEGGGQGGQMPPHFLE